MEKIIENSSVTVMPSVSIVSASSLLELVSSQPKITARASSEADWAETGFDQAQLAETSAGASIKARATQAKLKHTRTYQREKHARSLLS